MWLPMWAIERRRRARGAPPREPGPLLLVRDSASRRVVESACAASCRAGVRPGMALADARALLRGGAVVEQADPSADAAGLAALARWAWRWSPIVHAEPPDGLTLDITGCGHLFGGERGLVGSLLGALRRLGLTARAASACTPGAAWAASRFAPGGPVLIAPGGEREALAPLPVEALRLDAEAVAALAEVGVRRVGQLLALPRSALPARYGREALLRIDQALGAAFEGVERGQEEERFEAGVELPGGTTDMAALGLASREALERLCGALARRERGARRVELALARLDRERALIVLHLGRPTRSAKHLWALARPRLERAHLGTGVERVSACAGLVAPLPHEQGVLGPAGGARGADGLALAATLDTIANRIGPERVRRAELVESYRPERASRLVPALGAHGAASGAAPAGRPRPPVLLERPEPVRVVALSPDGPVIGLWRGGVGLEVVRSQGPERVGGEWWVAREGGRDYFRVQERTGRWLWIFREGGSWFIHGEWA